jgi:hypothetical protein
MIVTSSIVPRKGSVTRLHIAYLIVGSRILVGWSMAVSRSRFNRHIVPFEGVPCTNGLAVI